MGNVVTSLTGHLWHQGTQPSIYTPSPISVKLVSLDRGIHKASSCKSESVSGSAWEGSVALLLTALAQSGLDS